MRRSERIAAANLAKQQALIREGVPTNVLRQLARDVERVRRKVEVAVGKGLDQEFQNQIKLREIKKVIHTTHEDIKAIEEEITKYCNDIATYRRGEVSGVGNQMASQPARVTSAMSGGLAAARDEETVAPPVSPVYLRHGFETLLKESFLHSEEKPLQGQKRKRQAFECSAMTYAPFGTSSTNFMAAEEGKRRKKVRRQAPLSQYEQLSAQREHLLNELQLINARSQEAQRKHKFELECLLSIKKEAEKLKGKAVERLCAAMEELDTAFAAAGGKRRDNPMLIELDDDACSPNASETDSKTKNSEKSCLKFRFDYYFELTNSDEMHVCEYSEENAIDMEF